MSRQIERTRYLSGNTKGHEIHVDSVMMAVEEAESAIAFQLKEVAIPRTRQTVQSLRLDDPIHVKQLLTLNVQLSTRLSIIESLSTRSMKPSLKELKHSRIQQIELKGQSVDYSHPISLSSVCPDRIARMR